MNAKTNARPAASVTYRDVDGVTVHWCYFAAATEHEFAIPISIGLEDSLRFVADAIAWDCAAMEFYDSAGRTPQPVITELMRRVIPAIDDQYEIKRLLCGNSRRKA